MEKIETQEDLIDLGAASVETKGGGDSLNPDAQIGQYFPKVGLTQD